MIRKAAEVEAFVKKPDTRIRLALIYGQDAGKVRDVASRLTAQHLKGQDDPLASVSLSESELASEPARLYDEAAAVPMFGGQKIINLRLASEKFNDLIAHYLAQPVAECFIIIEAGNLTPKSELRKLVEKSDCGVTLPCYEDNARDIMALVRGRLESEGFRIESPALTYLTSRLGSDRGITLQELEKLVLYCGAGGEDNKTRLITIDDVTKAMGDNAALSLDDLIDAVASGDMKEAERHKTRLRLTGIDEGRILAALRGHFQSLYESQFHLAQGESQEAVFRKCFRPPLHFKRKASVQKQLSQWSKHKLESGLHILFETERASRSAGLPPAILCSQALLRLTLAAKR